MLDRQVSGSFCPIETGEQLAEIGSGEAPLERPGDALVVILEAENGTVYGHEVGISCLKAAHAGRTAVRRTVIQNPEDTAGIAVKGVGSSLAQRGGRTARCP